jgi:hypothetical protein
MYTAKIVEKIENQYGGVDITVLFTNGTEKEIRHIFSGITSKDDLKKKISQQIEFYTLSDGLKQDISVDEVVDLTKKEVIVEKAKEITDDQKKRDVYVQLAIRQDAFKKDIARGVIDSTYPEYVDVCSKLKAKYKPEYSGL